MCGINGAVSLSGQPIPEIERRLSVMNALVAHRGPDGSGTWTTPRRDVGLGHRRLAIIDLRDTAAQPMVADHNGTAIAFNGEIYNYIELRDELRDKWPFRTLSDTETILAAYDRYGTECLGHLRGMFAFALWDERRKRLFCARDRFGIKPFYYAVVDGVVYFASEAKALLPFLPAVETDARALAEYFTFQFTIGERTLFKGVRQLLPGQALCIEDGELKIWRYWDVYYETDHDHSMLYFERRLGELMGESIDLHLRSDVPVGAYLSGGIDSSLMGLLAARHDTSSRKAFNGRFTQYPGYDESGYASLVSETMGGELYIADVTSADFERHLSDVIYHLDFPTAGPGAFPQYMVSKLAAEHVKVVLGGQGGDEIFGGYARYLLAYFEQCIRAAVDGTYKNGNFVVTIETIVPNLGLLREYKPLMQQFWKEGLFGPLDERYFRLINRAVDMGAEVDWGALDMSRVFESFQTIFNSERNVRKEAYFDSMTHFDFKCLLPALLQVEDRMSMAHGLESRVPFLDHPLIEFAATIPADVKFDGGRLKHLLKSTFGDVLPEAVVNRRDKMGFPVPLKEWFTGDLRGMAQGLFESLRDRRRPFIKADQVIENFDKAGAFSRKTWALASFELWHQNFHDRAAEYRAMMNEPVAAAVEAS